MICFHTVDIPGWGDERLRWSLVNLLVPFWVGRWMARRYAGREVTGTLALAFLHAAINLCAVLVLCEAARTGAEAHLNVDLVLPLIHWYGDDYLAVLHSAILYATLYPVVVLAGVAFFRARQSRTGI